MRTEIEKERGRDEKVVGQFGFAKMAVRHLCRRAAERGAISLKRGFSPVISKCESTGNRFLTVLSGAETRETV
jgi:hypothetical protein